MKHETETAILQRLAEAEETIEALRKCLALVYEHLGLADPTDETLTNAPDPGNDLAVR